MWNGRFFFEGGGGSNGNVGNAFGTLQGRQPTVALALGYAVVSQDSGHDNQTNNDPARGGSQTFGFDPQARLDFGYNSYDQVATTAKAIIALYYGRAAEKSYFAGCSEGGREGMMLSQRFPAQFDGILACSPGFNLPRAAVAEAWDSQAFAEVARGDHLVDANGQPHVNKAFTDEDLALVSRAVLEACDAIDGAADGLVQSFASCTTPIVAPKLSAITCKGAKSETCVTPAQVAALKKVFGGARTSKGEAGVRRVGLGRGRRRQGRRDLQHGLAHLEARALRRAGQRRHQPDARRERASVDLRDAARSPCRRSAAEPPRTRWRSTSTSTAPRSTTGRTSSSSPHWSS